jgi:hypothetical protein
VCTSNSCTEIPSSRCTLSWKQPLLVAVNINLWHSSNELQNPRKIGVFHRPFREGFWPRPRRWSAIACCVASTLSVGVVRIYRRIHLVAEAPATGRFIVPRLRIERAS